MSLARSRFAQLWAELPALTVLAATPGWGRTTWMQQCDHALQSRDDLVTHWITGRRAFERYAPDGADAVVFVDELIHTADDPLWAQIAARLKTDPTLRLVVSTIDLPPRDLLAGIDMRIVDEADLAFTTDEIDDLARMNAPEALPDMLEAIATDLRGCPVLARRQLERAGGEPDRALWGAPGAPLALTRLADMAAFPVAIRLRTVLGRVLKQGEIFRRFSAALVALGLGEDLETVAADFARLRVSAMGTMTIDDQTGEEIFEWTPGVWAALKAAQTPEERVATAREALELTQRAGQITMQLFYLLEAGDFASAESLVFKNFRLFLLSTHPVTYRALVDAPSDALARHPNLLVLAGELRNRYAGANPESDAWFRLARSGLHPDRVATSFDRFRVVCRHLLAVVSLGDREGTRRGLRTVLELLGDADDPGLLALADQYSTIAERLAAEMYVPFWAATQIDEHQWALRFAELMRAYANDASPTTIAEMFTALTQENFAGVHSLGDDPVSASALSHSDPFLLIEEGRDEEALAMAQGLVARIRVSAPPKATAEAFVLLVRALLAPRTVDAEETDAAVQRSSQFWNDGVPGTFLTLAAVVAHLTAGDTPAAARLTQAHRNPDWFVLVAQALVALADDEPSLAMQALGAARERSPLPRGRAIVETLTAVAHSRLGRDDAAIALLESTWHASSERLMRFALRFVTPADFDVIASSEERLSPPLRAVIAHAADDLRALPDSAVPRLTPSELGILTLLSEGLSTPQIATQRVVSTNTVRTQLRMLFRKLGVASRAEAVARAEELGLLNRRGNGNR